jgi:hypothetical protein
MAPRRLDDGFWFWLVVAPLDYDSVVGGGGGVGREISFLRDAHSLQEPRYTGALRRR